MLKEMIEFLFAKTGITVMLVNKPKTTPKDKAEI